MFENPVVEIHHPNARLWMYKKENGNFEITHFVVEKDRRCQGIGTRIMNDICEYADKEGVTIELTPAKDFGASSVARLKRFYKRFGFVDNTGRNKRFEFSRTMYRLPVKERA